MERESAIHGGDLAVDRVVERCCKWIDKYSRGAPRLFFPNGIELIQVRARGPASNNLHDLEITIAGPGAQRGSYASRVDLALLGRVQQACEDAFDENGDDCNKFVKAVATSLGVTLSGNADDIVAEIQQLPWTYIGSDLEAAKKAADLAAQSKLVIGGLTSGALGEAHGHVIVVVPGNLVNGLYPVAYWGSIVPGKAAKLRGVNYAFQHPYCDSVRYSWIGLS
jgi:hypothetical protein